MAVLGGGPTGLAAAHRLAREHDPIRVDLYEASSRLGGVVTTEERDGFLYELGPASMNAKHPAVADLIYEHLQLSPHIEKRSAAAKNFFIVKKGEILAMPQSPVAFFQSKLLSWQAKIKILAEPLVRKLPEPEAGQESVGDFFGRRFGTELVEYVIDPALAGIYSTTPASLSMKHAFARIWNIERTKGSVIGGLFFGRKQKSPNSKYGTYSSKELRESFSYDNGMQVLTSSIESSLVSMNDGGHLYKNSKVRDLRQTKDGKWKVNGRGYYDAVISTIPTYALASINSNITSTQKGFQELAQGVEYAPASIVVLGFNKSQVPTRLDGFGALLPTNEGKKMLGINYTSSNFPTRVSDPSKVYLTVYVGGNRSPELPFRPAKEVVEVATKELRDVLGVEGHPFFSRVKTWSKGIPQYVPGFDKMLCYMARIEKGAPGVVLAGNYRDGVGLPDALMSGIKAAERTIDFLNSG